MGVIRAASPRVMRGREKEGERSSCCDPGGDENMRRGDNVNKTFIGNEVVTWKDGVRLSLMETKTEIDMKRIKEEIVFFIFMKKWLDGRELPKLHGKVSISVRTERR